MDIEIWKALIGAAATIISAIIVTIVGTRIANSYSEQRERLIRNEQQQRDRQIREKEWIDQAIELTKLDLDRKMNTWADEKKREIRPPILDFLAYYRDLKKLDKLTPGELYEEILKKHLAHRDKVRSDAESVEQVHLIVEE